MAPAEAVALAPVRAVERFVFAPEDARRLAAVRIGLCGLLAWRLAITDYAFVAGQPEALFDPVSVFELLARMPSEEITFVVQLTGVVTALAAAAGVATRATLPVAFCCSLFLNLMLNATGKIIHNDVLLTLCLMPLLAAPRAASTRWTLSRALGRPGAVGGDRSMDGGVGEAYGWPIRTAMVVIALAYFFVGFQKLRFSGIDWVTSENLRWVLYGASDPGGEPNPAALFVADRAWLSHMLAAGTVLIELCFPLGLVFPRLRWLFVPGVVSLHLGIFLAMDLDYSAQALTVVIVFANWAAVADGLARRLPLARGGGRLRRGEAPG